jgi:hypothetical protein
MLMNALGLPEIRRDRLRNHRVQQPRIAHWCPSIPSPRPTDRNIEPDPITQAPEVGH